jgi:hypothetical protein
MLRSDTRSDISVANEEVGIVKSAELSGVENADYGRAKLYCPFGELYHVDQGQSPAFRIYSDTNSAYCFACSKRFTPVSLFAMAEGISEDESATILLERIGYRAPDIESRWLDVLGFVPSIDHDSLATALGVACARMNPEWETLQFDEDVSTIFRKCLQLLPKVKTEDQAKQWLAKTKEVMRRTLGEPHD